MFNFGGKQETDPAKALENASKSLNSGLTGALARGFMGKDFVDKMNSTMAQGQAAIDGVNQAQMLMQNGVESSAEVIGIQDTGSTVNTSLVVMLQLKVTTAVGTQFEINGQTMVQRIAVPRAGDAIKIKYNPADPTQFIVL